jgi:threonine dehydrogenase-like Zn-dependent dehydrogenase
MKSLVKAKSERGLWREETPRPAVGPNDVLIKVKKAAICGTDLHIYNWDKWAARTIPVPMVVGHEYLGVIEEIGRDVTALKVGQRVSGEGHIVCGFCRNCRAGRAHLCRNTKGVGVNRPGAFADYVAIPASNAYLIPDSVSDEIAAILDPLGNAVHTALSFDLVGEDVLITGAGPIGLMAIAICRHVGARNIVITDVNDYRLDLARTMGATRAVRADRQTLKEVMGEIDMHEGSEGPARHDRRDEQWRQGRPARHPRRRGGDRLERSDLQGPDAERHLWPRDVRDLVQDARHAAERARCDAGHHASPADGGFRKGVCGVERRTGLQGGAGYQWVI